MRNLFWLVALLVSISCVPQNPHPEYLPEAERLAKGVANKYYRHIDYFDKQSEPSSFFYYVTQEKVGELMLEEYYDAGFNKYKSNVYQVTDNGLILKEEDRYYIKDTSSSIIIEPNYMRFDGQPLSFKKQIIQRDSSIYEVKVTHDGKTKIGSDETIISLELERYTTWNGANDQQWVDYIEYKKGVGKTFDSTSTSQMSFVTELVEQMPMKNFEILASNSPKRVGFIEIDSIENHLCGTEKEILDYYNGEVNAGFRSKKEFLNGLKGESLRFENESGYLTFRFIMNCNGEVSGFITEEADLNFEQKNFSKATKMHLLGILKDYEGWQPAVLHGVSRDAYVYVTFKMKDGKIIDILP